MPFKTVCTNLHGLFFLYIVTFLEMLLFLFVVFRVLNDAAVVMQKNYRGHLARKYFRTRVKVHCIVLCHVVNILVFMYVCMTIREDRSSFKHD